MTPKQLERLAQARMTLARWEVRAVSGDAQSVRIRDNLRRRIQNIERVAARAAVRIPLSSVAEPAEGVLDRNVAGHSNREKDQEGSTHLGLSQENCFTGETIVSRVRSGVKGASPQ